VVLAVAAAGCSLSDRESFSVLAVHRRLELDQDLVDQFRAVDLGVKPTEFFGAAPETIENLSRRHADLAAGFGSCDPGTFSAASTSRRFGGRATSATTWSQNSHC